MGAQVFVVLSEAISQKSFGKPLARKQEEKHVGTAVTSGWQTLSYPLYAATLEDSLLLQLLASHFGSHIKGTQFPTEGRA